jgi:hypothetical protein
MTTEEFMDYIMNEVPDEKIVQLFNDMGIDIDLTKEWKDSEDA